jgi:membrane protein DedA with SNARE-associated domain
LSLPLIPLISLIIGLGLAPVTTDFLLISIGIIAGSQGIPWYVVFPLVVIPMLLGEGIVFVLGSRIKNTKIAKRFSQSRLGVYLFSKMTSAKSKELWVLRLVPCYKATLLFMSAGMGLTRQAYLGKYLGISMVYSFVYFFVPFVLCKFIEIDVKQIMLLMISCFTVLIFASMLFRKNYIDTNAMTQKQLA